MKRENFVSNRRGIQLGSLVLCKPSDAPTGLSNPLTSSCLVDISCTSTRNFLLHLDYHAH